MTENPSGALLTKALLAAAILAAAAGCATRPPAPPGAGMPFPSARFAVLADPHLLDISTSSPGPAWDAALASGLKLHAESLAILDSALETIAAEKPDFVLVCGDLSKDGERASHELAARRLRRLREGTPGEPGPRVLVVPGNHDIENPGAARFQGDSVLPVPTVTAAQFAEIYAEMGFADALDRDPASLSYVAEPVPGLRVLALDSCRYRGNAAAPPPGGRVSPATLSWVRRVLVDARDAGVPVIAFLHHGLTEHFVGQGSFDSHRIVAGSERLNRLLVQGGARVVFTGHGHAQDVSVASAGGGLLIDVETGSLSSYPDPWRMVSLEPDSLVRIQSRFVSLTAAMPDGFPQHSHARMRQGIVEALEWGLGRAGVRSKDAARLAGQAAQTVELFFAGDEQAGEIRLDTEGMCAWGAMVGKILEGPLTDLGNDMPPPDNDLLIDLAALANDMRLRLRGSFASSPPAVPRTGRR